MVPTQFVETVALGDAPPYVEESCVSYCDLEAANRCKTGVVIGPGLVPKSFRDSIIVYLDSTRKKYISRVEYTTKMKPKSYSETNYLRPRAVCRSFASMVDYHAEGARKWYKTTVKLEPKVYSSSQQMNLGHEEEKKSEANDSNDATFDSMGYMSDDNSLRDPVSPLRLNEGQSSPLDDYRGWSKEPSPRSRRLRDDLEEEDINGNDYRHTKSRDSGYGASEVYESHWDPDAVKVHRSGPFIYNAPKERRRRYFDPLEDDMDVDNGHREVSEDKVLNGDDCKMNGHRHQDRVPRINGYNGYQHSDSEDDLVDL